MAKIKIAKAKTTSNDCKICAYSPSLKRSGDYEGLSKLPKDAHPSRLKLRDQTDGRPRGYMRKFGMSRIRFRELAHQGLIPGVKKQAGNSLFR